VPVQAEQLQAVVQAAELQALLPELQVFHMIYKTYPDHLTVHHSLNKTYLYLTCQK
jgi:hypothetical protein